MAKVPLQLDGRNASSTWDRTWTDYDSAAASEQGVGVGYVLAAGDGIVCLDLDHCLTDGHLQPWAQRILDLCPPTYLEVSPSGTGLHIFGWGTVGVGWRIRRDDGTAVECYDRGRFIAMTGQRFRGAPASLADLSAVLDQL